MSRICKAIIVVDLGFGDAGKGTIVDFLARTTGALTVVRFNGGPQAGHNVVTVDGRHHTFSQFGSGTFVPGVRTILAGPTLIEPYAMLREAAHLAEVGVSDALDRLEVDRACRVITPVHVAANRIRERARKNSAHGTCGMGVGEAVADSILRPELTVLAGDLADADVVVRKLRAMREYKLQSLSDAGLAAAVAGTLETNADWEVLADPAWIDVAVERYRTAASRFSLTDADAIGSRLGGLGTVIFEGAQGVLLDENFGFHPHTTWSDTTAGNAKQLLARAGVTAVRRIGVIRTYATRHGAGPMVSEDPSLNGALVEPHNGDDGPQGKFRVGHFDVVATRYALRRCPVDEIAVTHLERLEMLPAVVCERYAGDGFGIDYDGQILLVEPDDLARRSEQTRTLLGAEPVMTERPADQDGFLTDLSIRLGVTIDIVSSGPTAADKHHRRDSE